MTNSSSELALDSRWKAPIDAAEIISFDIFDTLILRRTGRPQDVFGLMEELACAQSIAAGAGFRSWRVQVERELRQHMRAERGSPEVTLAEIYSAAVEKRKLSAEDADRLREMEMATERQVCCRNPYVYQAYEYCLKQDKQVIFVSDMYLPKDLIRSVLTDAGYGKEHALFLSNETGVSKRTGEMFPHVLESLQVEAQDILHIGDDEVSDVEQARHFGLRALHYRRSCVIAEYDSETPQGVGGDSIYAMSKGMTINRFYAGRPAPAMEEDYWYRFGYETVGLMFLGFGQWVAEQVVKQGVQRVFFLSRDGFIMDKFYRLLRRQDPNLPESCYVHASRKALHFASLGNFDEYEIEFFVRDADRLTLKSYLERLGLDASRHHDEISAAGFRDAGEWIVPRQRQDSLRRLLLSLKGDILEQVRHQRLLVDRYLEQEGFWNSGKIAIVDIGWQGSMQLALGKVCKALGKEVELTGLYLGTFATGKDLGHTAENFHGYLCQFSEPADVHASLLRSVPLFEFLHSAPHGSVCGYANNGKVVEAQFGNNYIPEQNEIALRMQQGALDFAQEYLVATSSWKHLKITPEIAFAPLRQVVEKPTPLQALQLGDLRHIDSFDQADASRYFARPPQLRQAWNLKLMRRQYLQSQWKKGYQRRLFCWQHWFPKKAG